MSTTNAKKNVSTQVEDPNVRSGTGREERMNDFSPEWCQQLLNDPSYSQWSPYTRKPDWANSMSNTLMGETLFTDHTLRAIRFLYKPPESVVQQGGETSRRNEHDSIGGELIALISLGEGMCSHANTLHGGINTMLVDEIGGVLALKEIREAESLMAVNFNVDLRKSVKTPGIVLGRAWIERLPETRKVWVKVRLEQNGQTCIESENLYLKMNLKGNL